VALYSKLPQNLDTDALQVKRTMNNIKFALTERYYAWEGAQKLAQMDPEVYVDEVKSSVEYDPSEETMEAREIERRMRDIEDSAEEDELDERPEVELIPKSIVRIPKSNHTDMPEHKPTTSKWGTAEGRV
jgi:hypothetical protein